MDWRPTFRVQRGRRAVGGEKREVGKQRTREGSAGGGMEEDGEPEEGTRVLSLPVHILGHHERVFAIARG